MTTNDSERNGMVCVCGRGFLESIDINMQLRKAGGLRSYSLGE